MDKKQVEDAIFEALLRQVVIDKYHSEIQAIPSNEELVETISFTPEFEIRMKRLFAHERRKELMKTIFLCSKRAAEVFIIAIVVLFGILLFNPEVRAATKNAIVGWYRKFTSITFIGESYETNKKDWYPKFLPDGYSESSIENLGRVTYIEFVNKAGEKIRFSYRAEDNTSNLSVDSENHKIGSTKINENVAYTAIATMEEFENGIIWVMDGYKMDIWSRLPIIEIKKVAESVSEKK